jgi:ferredoxin-NADP reductase
MMAFRGRIASVKPQTSKLSSVTIDVSAEAADAHCSLGQVLAFDAQPEKVYLALASQPGRSPYEVLASRDAMDALDWREGADVDLPRPFGSGFPLERADGHDVLLFAVGSALGPMRSVVDAIRDRRSDFGFVRLYAGAHTPAEMPYADRFAAWARDRVDIVASHSRPWVQDRFREDPPPLDDAVAFVCGMDAMMREVETTLRAAGLPRERIHRNW